MGYKTGDAEKALAEINKTFDAQKAIKESLEFPAQDQIQFLGKMVDPKEFANAQDVVTREVTTANLSEADYRRVVAILQTRVDFMEFKKQFFDPKEFTSKIDMIDKKLKDVTDEKVKAALNEKKEKLETDRDDNERAIVWIDSVIFQAGAYATIICSSSKGKDGFLAKLAITTRKIGEVITGSVRDQTKGMFKP